MSCIVIWLAQAFTSLSAGPYRLVAAFQSSSFGSKASVLCTRKPIYSGTCVCPACTAATGPAGCEAEASTSFTTGGTAYSKRLLYSSHSLLQGTSPVIMAYILARGSAPDGFAPTIPCGFNDL